MSVRLSKAGRRGLMAAAGIVFLAVPMAASAQELWLPFRQEMEAEGEELPMKSGLLVAGRISWITGEVDPWVPADYDDIFHSGYGLAVEGRLLWEVEYGGWIGGYLSLGWERYEGQRDTDAYGDSLEPDEMDITTVLAGIKWIVMVAPRFYLETHMGVGVARYGSVDGTFTTGGIPEAVEVFEATSTGAFDIGGRIGYSRRRFVAEIGFGLRFQGSPDNADFDFDSSGPLIFSLEAAVGLQF